MPFILFIEDNPIALRMIEAIATKLGCRYVAATQGEKALKLAKTIHFDLIITVINLPDMSGAEFARQIRTWEKIKNKKPIPIIGLTAQEKTIASESGILSGMTNAFTKPIDIKTMRVILDQYGNTNSAITSTKINATKIKNIGQLGLDLPNEEHQLFYLDQFPLLNINSAIKKIGNENLLIEILELMLNNAIPNDTKKLTEAYNAKNWALVEKIAHKIKGGAIYCGTTRLKYACQYLERYQKAGHSTSLEALYQQLTVVIKETKQTIQTWLDSKNKPS